MTREEAISALTGIQSLMSIPARLDALDMAIAALREQEERSEGCSYCSDSERDLYYHDGACHAMNDLVYVTGNSIVCDFGCKAYASFEIKFCPMCGRRLEEV